MVNKKHWLLTATHTHTHAHTINKWTNKLRTSWNVVRNGDELYTQCQPVARGDFLAKGGCWKKGVFLISCFVFQDFPILWCVPSITHLWSPWPSNCVSVGMAMACKASQVTLRSQTARDGLGLIPNYPQRSPESSPSLPAAAPYVPRGLLPSR